ncbi:MAG TPA: hypothetical protein DCE17_00470 [Lactobacillus sp.]|uniref:hypothetical protein n=1 Tax=Ligilactobacillus murinus TaxID=1622 RepID=UPI00096D616D|nr:hypothetical protein [Ligilactobacillus murinus]HAB48888.1 hypothetical protein [Lactobacillus sp.]HAP23595.1 hypothetical protein [Lactobacillus sp.]
MALFLLFLGGIGYYLASEKLRLGNGLSCTTGIFFAFIPYLLFYHFKGLLLSTVLIVAVLLVIGYYSRNDTKKKWVKKEYPFISPYKLADDMEKAANTPLEDEEKPMTYEALADDLPYNRVQAFANGSKLNSENQDAIFPIFYNAHPANNEMAFREYGYLVLTTGIIYKRQIEASEKSQEKYLVKEVEVPFANIFDVSRTDTTVTIDYYNDETKRITSDDEKTVIFLYKIIRAAIDNGWTKNCTTILHNLAQVQFSDVDDLTQEIDTNYEVAKRQQQEVQKLASAEDVEQVFEKEQVKNIDAVNRKLVDNMTNVNVTNDILNTNIFRQHQVNDRFSGAMGHGHAGELMGDTMDKLKLKKTSMDGNSHVKHGADRVVNGTNIQTKYYSTAGKSIGACFENGTAKYINPDGSMMKIEVPRDQYNKAVKAMARRIENGEVPNESNPQNAARYVKRGALSYEHSQIATKSIFDRGSTIVVDGKVQSVSFGQKLVYSVGGDFLTGVANTMPTVMISQVWYYVNARWHGQDAEEALKGAVLGAVKPILVGASIYTVSSQFGGSNLAKSIFKGATSENIAKGTAIGVTAAITIGPDVIECLRGRISMQQLVKNTAVTAAGAATGAAIGSIVPGIGTVIGGMVGTMAAKAIADKFTEDDSVRMIRIAKEEFIDLVIFCPLKQAEFDEIVNKVFVDKNTTNLYKEMFASGNARKHIRDLYRNMITDKLKKREINEEEIIETVQLYSGVFQSI